jgi:alpha-amylase/alpha-mannosidase (GH57 family)
MGSPRYICVHGHFYQPPRENPWLEAVEVQDSAAPFHDWNERITRECYAPNSRSRLVDNSGKIINLLNNYAWMSFNFGPTLLAWLAEEAPEVLHGIVEGDRLSRERRRGHGSALAQVYNHVIMPLASAHDKKTELQWGIADFKKRFGRDPEGLWLAETAADVPTLEALAAAGIRFTILAPRQAKRWRKIGTEAWQEGGVDPSRAYLCRLPSGKTIDVFFYDGNISQMVAFERLLDSGEKFLSRLTQGFDDKREHPQLMHIATDGESYGHHHAHGDMALAYVLYKLHEDPNLTLTNYGEFLELHPPEWEAEIWDNSSWSCAHGVERWRSDCGCKSRGDWQQKWRGPLREAFNSLKDRLDALFIERGKELFPDPWAARNGYIDVILDRSDESVQRFLEKYARPALPAERVREALWLLEMQRHALLMYTSCGWFFDEISGLETTQCLRYAARAMQLARHFELDYEEDFLTILEKAPSNLPNVFKSGRDLWEQLIRPAKIDLDRVLAHFAISSIYRPATGTARVYLYDIETLDHEAASRGGNHLVMGRLHVRSRLTQNEADTSFVVIHYGGLDFYTVLRRPRSTAEYEEAKKKFFQTYETGSLAELTALVTREFDGEVHHLDDLFTDERRRIIDIVLHDRFEEYVQTFERLADQDEDVLNRLGRMRYPIPRGMLTAAAVSIDRRLRDEINRLDADGATERVQNLLNRGKAWGYQPDAATLALVLTEELQGVTSEINAQSDLAAVTRQAVGILDTARLLGVPLDLWQTQNRLLDAYAGLQASNALTDDLKRDFAALAEKLTITPALLGWRP